MMSAPLRTSPNRASWPKMGPCPTSPNLSPWRYMEYRTGIMDSNIEEKHLFIMKTNKISLVWFVRFTKNGWLQFKKIIKFWEILKNKKKQSGLFGLPKMAGYNKKINFEKIWKPGKSSDKSEKDWFIVFHSKFEIWIKTSKNWSINKKNWR
jgi:hypothetical protein